MKKGLIFGALLLSGCSVPPQSTQQDIQTLHYACGTLPLTVQVDNSKEEVSMILDGKQLTLKQQIAASGARYSDGQYVFWSKGNTAFVERNDKVIIDDCQMNNG